MELIVQLQGIQILTATYLFSFPRGEICSPNDESSLLYLLKPFLKLLPDLNSLVCIMTSVTLHWAELEQRGK